MICTSFRPMPVRARNRPKLRCWQWAQALLQARFNGWYELRVADRKQALFSGIRGNVLEIGPGTGANLVYLPVGIKWIGIEPNIYMHGYLMELGAQLGVRLDLRVGNAEQLQVPDDSLDAVISTQGLCWRTDPASVMREIQRVLKPGGRFLFMAHVAAESGTKLRRWQHLACPLCALLGDECHPALEIRRDIEQAGLKLMKLDYFEVAAAFFSKPQVAGVAIKLMGKARRVNYDPSPLVEDGENELA